MAGCKSDLIHCPEYKPIKLRHSNPYSYRTIRPDRDLTASSNTLSYKELQKLRSKRDEKKDVDIEEWDCPRPGAQKNRKMVKEAIKRMEKKQREEERHQYDSTEMNSLQPFASL